MGLSPIFLHLSLNNLDDHFLNVYLIFFFFFSILKQL